jgi:NHLM bacteriocin system secretion protein
MPEIYRKAALDRLASPEQLDKQIKITSPMGWLATAGIAVVLASVVIWAFLGSLPEKVEVNGMYVNDGITNREYVSASGSIEVLVFKDEVVKKNQVLARIDSEEIDKTVEQIEKDIAEINGITIDSSADESSSQTSPLLEIKEKYLMAGLTSKQYDAQLSQLSGELSNQTKEVERLKQERDNVEHDYLVSIINSNATTETQYDLSVEGTELDSATSTLQSAASTLQSAASTLESTQTAYDTAVATYGKGSAEEIAAKANLAAEQTAYNAAQTAYNEAKSTYNNKKSDYETASDKYETAVKNQGDTSALQQRYYNDFSQASTNYSNAYSIMKNIESSIDNLNIQMIGDDISVELQMESLLNQFDKTKEAMLSELDKELEKQKESYKHLEVKAQQDGIVTELLVEDSQIVSAGTPTLKIKAIKDKDNMIVCYVPIFDAKKIQVGMNVAVTPSTVLESEYGHMNGIISSIGEFNATTMEMSQMFGDDLMVSSLQQQGPSVEIRMQLTQDINTVSGYEWSNKKGAEIALSQGTIVSVNVITAQKAPITKLLPYLDEKMKVTIEESDE